MHVLCSNSPRAFILRCSRAILRVDKVWERFFNGVCRFLFRMLSLFSGWLDSTVSVDRVCKRILPGWRSYFIVKNNLMTWGFISKKYYLILKDTVKLLRDKLNNNG